MVDRSKAIPQTFRIISEAEKDKAKEFEEQYYARNAAWLFLEKAIDMRVEQKRRESEKSKLFELPGYRAKQDHLKGEINALITLKNDLFPSKE